MHYQNNTAGKRNTKYISTSIVLLFMNKIIFDLSEINLLPQTWTLFIGQQVPH